MRKDRGLVILAAAAPLAALLPVGTLAGLGGWLRELSLSGPGGNAGAWAIVLGLTALPALGLLWRGRRRADWLLLLAAGEILAGLFYLVNPTLLTAEYGAGNVIALAAAGCVGATLLAWAAMRGLGGILASERPGRTMERLLRWSGWAWAWLAGLWQEIRRTAEGNSALDTGALMPTYLTLGVLAVMDLVPALLCCQILRWGGRLALGLEEDPFGGETVALAEELGGRCAGVAGGSAWRGTCCSSCCCRCCTPPASTCRSPSPPSCWRRRWGCCAATSGGPRPSATTTGPSFRRLWRSPCTWTSC